MTARAPAGPASAGGDEARPPRPAYAGLFVEPDIPPGITPAEDDEQE